MRLRLLSLSLFPILLLASCQRQRHHLVTPSIYYWKTVYALTPYEQSRWDAGGIQRVYIRCFDVAIDPDTQQPKPVGVLRNFQPDGSRQFVPVVFVTQDLIRSLAPQQVLPLANDMSRLLSQLFNGQNVDELQIDCDWTASSRAAYFALLRALRNTSFAKGKILSATIRLHQVKYRISSGIPPVDRGMLMCYNMGDLKQPGAHNSILDVPLVKAYLTDLRHYPLKLDLALPIFSWCLHFRDNRFFGILHDISLADVQASHLFRDEGRQTFSCMKDTSWKGYSFRGGDMLRVEEPEQAALAQTAAFTARNISNDSLRVVIFASDSLSLTKHPKDEIQAIFNTYR